MEEHRDVLLPGTVLDGKYRIERVLGSGGFGITYEAMDLGLDTKVAVKEYYPTSFAIRDSTRTVRPISGRESGMFQRLLQSFLREARTLARFDSAAIVRVNNVFEAHGTAYMVMRYEAGPSLKAWRAGIDRPPTQEELDRIVAPLLDALETLHEADFLHRDVAPDNIIIRPDGSPVLLDFGASRRVMGELTSNLTAIVKPGFSPPEQYTADAKLQGPWTDIYALAATIYQVVTDNKPIEASQRMGDRVETADELIEAGMRPGFADAVDAALEFRPEHRPQSIAEWREMLFSDAPPDALRKARAAGRAENDKSRVGGTSRSGPRSSPRSGARSRPEPQGGRSRPGTRGEALPPEQSRGANALVWVGGGIGAILLGLGGWAAADCVARQRAATVIEDELKRAELRRKAEEDARRRIETAALEDAERRRIAEEERRRKAEDDRQRAEQERRRIEEDNRRRAEQEAADARRRAEEEAARRRAEALADEQRRRAEEIRRQAEAAEARRRAEEEARAKAEDARKRAEAEARQRAEEEARRQAEDARRQAEAAAAEEARRLAEQQPRVLPFAAAGRSDRPTAVAFGQGIVAAGGQQGSMRLWVLGEDRTVDVAESHRDQVTAVAVAPEGNVVAAGAWNGELRLFDAATGGLVRVEPATASDAILAVRYLARDQLLVAHASGRVRIYNPGAPANATALRTQSAFALPGAPAQAAAISADGTRVAASTADSTISYWNVQNGQAVGQPMRGHRDWPLALAFSRDGRRLASGATDGAIRVWDLATRQAQEVKNERSIRAIAFSPDGRLLATAGDDTAVALWIAVAGQAPRAATRFNGHRDTVRALAFSDDGRRLVSVAEDGEVRIWPVPAQP